MSILPDIGDTQKTKGTQKAIKPRNKGKSSAIMMSYFFHIWLLILLFKK